MTAVIRVEIRCDFPDCGAVNAGSGMVKVVRGRAKQLGWTSNSYHQDRCPKHSHGWLRPRRPLAAEVAAARTALAAAEWRRVNGATGVVAAREHGVTQNAVAAAGAVITHAPELVGQVRAGVIGLGRAYRVARERRDATGPD